MSTVRPPAVARFCYAFFSRFCPAASRLQPLRCYLPGVNQAAPRVSVVVPTYRRDELLARCLREVVAQDLPAHALEIIVVDDAQSSTAPRVVADIAAGTAIPIVCLPGKSRGPAAARNVGWRAARGEVVAFIDDDAYPADSNWLRQGLACLEREGAAAVSGTVVVPLQDQPTDFQRNVKRLEEAAFLTCNAFVPRALLEEVGGFDERFRVAFREDSDLQFRIEASGRRIARAAEAIVIHPASPGRWGVSVRLQRYSMYNALMYKKHPERFRELRAGPPWHYYAMLLLALGAVLTLLAGAPLVAAALALAFGALWLRFFLRRLDGASREPAHVVEMAVTSVLIPPVAVFWRLRGALAFRVLFL